MHERHARALSDSRFALFSGEFHTPVAEPQGGPTRAPSLIQDCARSQLGNALMLREFLRHPSKPSSDGTMVSMFAHAQVGERLLVMGPDGLVY
jgi:hypothetical protein